MPARPAFAIITLIFFSIINTCQITKAALILSAYSCIEPLLYFLTFGLKLKLSSLNLWNYMKVKMETTAPQLFHCCYNIKSFQA